MSKSLASTKKMPSTHFHHHAALASSASVTPCSLLASPPSSIARILSRRSLSTNKDDGKPPSGSDGDDDKNFFLQNDEESLPTPPSYVRDAITGKWTDRTHAELSRAERKLLNLDEESKAKELMTRLEKRWKDAASANADSDDHDGFGTLHSEQRRVAHRIQEENLALGMIGRDPSLSFTKTDGSSNNNDDDDDAAATDQQLSSREFQSLKHYAEKEHNIHPKDFARLNASDPDLIPHHNSVSSGRGGSEGNTDSKQFFDADLDLAHLDPKLNKLAFSDNSMDHHDPFADLLPSDFNPTRKVNRKHAKLLPKRLLHHNNLSLLRRYTTPGGKIMNRVQSRLGAKDQRKIAKLVKRARHLGLIPHIGQWKFEDHGHLHERGLCQADNDGDGGKREWEVELEKRGLWPLADENEMVRRFYDVDGILEHLAGPVDSDKRKELEELLTGGVGMSSEATRNSN